MYCINSEILLGTVLGQGEFGTVREVNRLAVFDSFGSFIEDKDASNNTTTHHIGEDGGGEESKYSTPPPRKHKKKPSSLTSSAFGKLFDEEQFTSPFGGISGGTAERRGSGPFKSIAELDKSRYAMQELHNKDGRARYAVKRVREDLTGIERTSAALDLAAEAMFLSSIAHPNIVRLRGAAGIPGHPNFMVIMDRLYETLDERVKGWKEEQQCHLKAQSRPMLRFWKTRQEALSINLAERVMVGYDISRALNFLHHHRIIYRDLKPVNLGFDVRGNVRLFDLGLAKELKECDRVEEGRYKCTPLTGTRRWMVRVRSPHEIVLGGILWRGLVSYITRIFISSLLRFRRLKSCYRVRTVLRRMFTASGFYCGTCVR